ncbi:MAG: GNAT family N-acetyltransferase [Rikenellaceae bacterium]|nr:GNAT family N-acetyltransferase [Rikenellaceae bacterium]
MELLKITPSESRLWEQVWRLYNESFPEYGRRRVSSHTMACEDPDFHTYISIDNGNLLALLFYWTYGKTIYIEHVAVDPQMRGKNIGSKLLTSFARDNADSTIMLEIDPPVDEISKRRLAFYERIGFKNTGRIFTHPSYSRNGQGHELLVLSFPDETDDAGYEAFMEFVSEKVLKYRD